jgi:hypothetical protein
MVKCTWHHDVIPQEGNNNRSTSKDDSPSNDEVTEELNISTITKLCRGLTSKARGTVFPACCSPARVARGTVKRRTKPEMRQIATRTETTASLFVCSGTGIEGPLSICVIDVGVEVLIWDVD